MATTTVPLQISPGKPPAPWPLSPPVLSILNSATRGRQRTKGGGKVVNGWKPVAPFSIQRMLGLGPKFPREAGGRQKAGRPSHGCLGVQCRRAWGPTFIVTTVQSQGTLLRLVRAGGPEKGAHTHLLHHLGREFPSSRHLSPRRMSVPGALPTRTPQCAGQISPGAGDGRRRPLQVLPAQLRQERIVSQQAGVCPRRGGPSLQSRTLLTHGVQSQTHSRKPGTVP